VVCYGSREAKAVVTSFLPRHMSDFYIKIEDVSKRNYFQTLILLLEHGSINPTVK
jgi:hypothetical protein